MFDTPHQCWKFQACALKEGVTYRWWVWRLRLVACSVFDAWPSSSSRQLVPISPPWWAWASSSSPRASARAFSSSTLVWGSFSSLRSKTWKGKLTPQFKIQKQLWMMNVRRWMKRNSQVAEQSQKHFNQEKDTSPFSSEISHQLAKGGVALSQIEFHRKTQRYFFRRWSCKTWNSMYKLHFGKKKMMFVCF